MIVKSEWFITKIEIQVDLHIFLFNELVVVEKENSRESKKKVEKRV